MSDTPGKSGDRSSPEPTPLPAGQHRPPFKFATDDTDVANAILCGYRAQGRSADCGTARVPSRPTRNGCPVQLGAYTPAADSHS